MAPDDIGKALDEYLEIGGFIDGGMQQQTRLDLDSLERATGRRLTLKKGSGSAPLSSRRSAGRSSARGSRIRIS